MKTETAANAIQVMGIQWPPPSGAVFWVSVCLVVAGLLGEASVRYLKLPRLVGYVATGVIAGLFGVGVSDGRLPDAARVVLDLAMALLLFEAGTRISVGWLRRNPWLTTYCVAEAMLSFAAVSVVLIWMGMKVELAIALGSIVMATSPGVLLRISAEFNTAGQVTERMLVMAGLGTGLAVLVSRFVGGWLMHESGGSVSSAMSLPIYQLVVSAAIAAVLAAAVAGLTRVLSLRSDYVMILLIGLILLALSAASITHASTLLVPLLAGILLRNLKPRATAVPRSYGTAGGMLILMLFVTTGASWTPDHLVDGALFALGLIVARMVAKLGMAVAFSRPSGISLHQGLALGMTSLPLSAAALVMFLNFEQIAPTFAAEMAPTLFTAVLVLEIIGPIVAKAALHAVREEHPT